VAYRSDESGREEIYIQGYPDKRGKWLVPGSGGEYAAWRQDGKELYTGRAEGMVMATTIELGANGLQLGRPQQPFRRRFQRLGPHRQCDRYLRFCNQ